MVAVLFLVGACVADGSSSTTLIEPSTTPGTVPTTTTTKPIVATTTILLPDEPQVTTGWSLQKGDVLVASLDGVSVVRGGEVVSHPVTSPVEAALHDGYGGVVFVTPLADLFPDHWPKMYGGGGYTLWRAFPDGTLQAVLRTGPISVDGPVGTITVYQVGRIDSEVIPADLDEVSVPFLAFGLVSAVGNGSIRDEIWMLAFHQDGIYPTLTVKLGGFQEEGGFTGAGWQESGVIVSIASDAGGWLEAWQVFSDPEDYPVEHPAEWPTNPVPTETPCPDDATFDHCLDTVTTLPGSTLIAYTETYALQRVTDLIVYDTATGTEIRRLPVAESMTRVKMLHASAEQIVVSLILFDGERYVHAPAIVVDVDTGATRQLPVPGVATIVP